jgi:hypothetical protein
MGDAYANRGSRLDSVLADMQAKKQQQRMVEEQKRQHEEAIRAQILMKYMADPSQEAHQALSAAGYNLPQMQMTPEQSVRRRAAERGMEYYDNPQDFAPGFSAANAHQVGTGAALPKEIGAAAVTRDVYTRPNMPQQMIENEDIAGGRKMSAFQGGTLNETTRHNKVGEGYDGQRTTAQAFRDFAAGRTSNAQTGYVGAQTEVQKRTPGSAFNRAHVERVGGAAAATAAAKGNAEAAGKVNAEAKPAQLKAANFHGRMVHALSEVEGKDGKGGVEDAIARRWYGGQQRDLNTPDALNFLRTPEAQRYRAAQREFTEARLRKESGAAIPVHEYETDAKMYFFQPGDSLDVLAQKRRARQSVIAGVAAEAGPAVAAAPLSRDEAEQQVSGAAPSGGTPLTEGEAVEFLRRAGGDPNKARELARQAGRSF